MLGIKVIHLTRLKASMYSEGFWADWSLLLKEICELEWMYETPSAILFQIIIFIQQVVN